MNRQAGRQGRGHPSWVAAPLPYPLSPAAPFYDQSPAWQPAVAGACSALLSGVDGTGNGNYGILRITLHALPIAWTQPAADYIQASELTETRN